MVDLSSWRTDVSHEYDLGGRRFTRREMLVLAAGLYGLQSCTRKGESCLVSSAPQPNVIIFLADSLRADHLGCYGYPKPTSPNIDALSQESYLFERCYSAATWTKPSIASLFTGVPPSVHQAGCRSHPREHSRPRSAQRLRASFPTLAEELQKAGYQTAWFLGNPLVVSEYGFARGMGHYCYQVNRPVAEQISNISHWLRTEAREPFFLMIHMMDPHYPYTAPAEAFRRLYNVSPKEYLSPLTGYDSDFLHNYVARAGFMPNAPSGEGTLSDSRKRAIFQGLSVEGRKSLAGLYDAEINHADHLFGQVLDTLRGTDRFGRSVIVATSDHGEAFGEHGLFYHQNPPFECQIRVPLVIRVPASPRNPVRVPHTVSQCGLFATLLSFAGAETPNHVVDAPFFDGSGQLAVTNHLPAFSSFDHWSEDPADWDISMVVGGLKVTRRATGEFCVCDLNNDPGECSNLLDTADAPPDSVRQTVERFRQELDRQEKLARSFGEPEWMTESKENFAAAEALGYL